jgi:hypothetical protein
MTARSGGELERALHDLGLRCRVEAYDALAVAVAEPGERAFEDENIRRRAIALARAHGFSHLAVELSNAPENAPDRATLSGD